MSGDDADTDPEPDMFTITTSKGTFSAESLREVCEWQAEHLGEGAEISDGIVSANVDAVNFNLLPFAITHVSMILSRRRRELEGPPAVETLEDYPVTEDGADW